MVEVVGEAGRSVGPGWGGTHVYQVCKVRPRRPRQQVENAAVLGLRTRVQKHIRSANTSGSYAEVKQYTCMHLTVYIKSNLRLLHVIENNFYEARRGFTSKSELVLVLVICAGSCSIEIPASRLIVKQSHIVSTSSRIKPDHSYLQCIQMRIVRLRRKLPDCRA